MSAQIPNSEVAIGFLRQLRPAGPWAITAIEPDRPAITTRTFGPESVEELLAFLAEHNGRRNLYYALNPPAQAANKKAKKKDAKKKTKKKAKKFAALTGLVCAARGSRARSAR